MEHQAPFSRLIDELRAMRPQDQRVILAALGKTERAGVRRLLKLPARPGSPDPLLVFRLEQLGYSAPLQRHLRRMLAGRSRTGATLTPATQVWLTQYLLSPGELPSAGSAPAGSEPAEKPSGLRLAAVSGGRRTAPGGG